MRRTHLLLLVSVFGCDSPLTESASQAPAPSGAEPLSPVLDGSSLPAVIPTPASNDDDLPYLVSRFAPMRGLDGTRIQILTAFDPAGCAVSGECKVMIGEDEALIEGDEGLLEVIAPGNVATGELCVTWRGRTECSGTFEVLTSPLVYTLSPMEVAAGSEDTTLTITGDGFTDETSVFFDWQQLEAHVTAHHTLTVSVPAELLASAKTASLHVFVPARRCGVRSEPFELQIVP